MPADVLIPALIYATVVLILTTSVFLVAQLKRDNSVMDIAYGPIFAISSWVTLYLQPAVSEVAWLMALLVTAWAARLGGRIARKNWGKPEDARYAAWRSAWQQHGQLYVVVRSYIQINILQGVIITIVSLPLILALAAPATTTLSVVSYVGATVFLIGLLLETIADWQLDRFIAGKKAGTETATLMTRGLFHYSRRPNYFGESLVWWGLSIIAATLPLGALAVLSPLLITFIVTRVTGPILEAQFLERYPAEYGAYMARTSYFIPLPPRS